MAYLDSVRVQLQDAAAEALWTDAEINSGITDALVDFSRRQGGQEIYDTDACVTIANSRLVDIDSLTSVLLYGNDRRSFHPTEGLEYPVAKWPRRYRNFRVFDTYIEMDKTTAPSTGNEAVYLRYYKAWTEATMPSIWDDLVIRMATAKCLIFKPRYFINEIMDETTKFDNITTALDEMNSRIIQAISDSDNGRNLIGDKRDEFIAAVNTVDDRVNQAINDIATAQTYFNKANVGRPESEYLNSAISQLQVSSTKLNQAAGYISEVVPDSHRQQANIELNSAVTSLRKAQGYINHFQERIRAVNLGDKYEAIGLRMLQALEPEIRKTRHYRAAFRSLSRG